VYDVRDLRHDRAARSGQFPCTSSELGHLRLSPTENYNHCHVVDTLVVSFVFVVPVGGFFLFLLSSFWVCCGGFPPLGHRACLVGFQYLAVSSVTVVQLVYVSHFEVFGCFGTFEFLKFVFSDPFCFLLSSSNTRLGVSVFAGLSFTTGLLLNKFHAFF